jgi:tRNA pseudouridine55 synthase
MDRSSNIIDGVLVINKPRGCTSHDVVSRVKRMIGAKKVGHLGTLDPMATGVLPLVINKATKSATRFQGGVKEYIATMKLGEETDTLDAEGKVVESKDASGIKIEDVEKALYSFIGKIEQTPPMFSAVKQGGVPLYKLARKGKTVAREPKQVEIFSIEILSSELPFVSFKVECSRGTYIRSLCHDTGAKLGCGAHLTELQRSRSGIFTIDESLGVEQGRDALINGIIPLNKLKNSEQEQGGQGGQMEATSKPHEGELERSLTSRAGI